MRREGMTRLDAAHEWVREFNAIQQGIIERLMRDNPDEWTEVTVPSAGDRVYVYDVPEGYSHEGEIHNYDMESDLYFVEPDEGKMLSVEREMTLRSSETVAYLCGLQCGVLEIALMSIGWRR